MGLGYTHQHDRPRDDGKKLMSRTDVQLSFYGLTEYSIDSVPHSSLVLGLQQFLYGGTFLSTKFIHIAKTQIPLHAMLNRNNIIENGFKHYEILILLEYVHTNMYWVCPDCHRKTAVQCDN